MIYVSHRLDEVFRVADRVVVLRDGRLVGEEPIEQTTPARLIGMIVGRSTFDAFKKDDRQPGAVRVSVSGLTTARAGPVDFEVRSGELLGLVGLRGAGQEDIGRALFGATPHQGMVAVDGEALDLSSPYAALSQGVGLMARDRAEESVAPSMTVRENLFLNPAALGRGAFSPLSPRAEAEKRDSSRRVARPRPNDPALAIEGLSGGNQQKVVVGRWLATDRRLLIAEDPTAGVDVGAKAEDLRPDRPRARRGSRGRRRLHRLRGGRADLPSGARVQSRPDRRANWRATALTIEAVITAASGIRSSLRGRMGAWP